jgi:NRPS condensation-like uncharacterized protein
MTQSMPQLTSKTNTYPMVSFEHYMLADDRPTHSMAVQMRFHFKGLFDRQKFQQALDNVLDRHPIFQMRLQGNANQKTSDIRWVKVTTKTFPYLSWLSLTDPITHPKSPFHFDLTDEIGLRIWIRDNAENIAQNEPKTELLTQFHHSVCDGIGMLEFMEDLLIHYGLECGLQMPTPRRIDQNLFSKRGNFWLEKSDWKTRLMKDIKRAFNFFRSLAAPLATPSKQEGRLSEIADLFASERSVLSEEILMNIRAAARSANGSVNDILLYQLFKTLSSWNKNLGQYFLKTRIALAVSLRLKQDAEQSAVNIVSMVFLDKSHRDVESSQKLLQSIIEETTDIKTNRMGLTLPRVMSFFGKIPYAIKFFMNMPLCSATAVLTNLGSTLSKSPLLNANGKIELGSITLESYELLPPVRPKTSASFAVNYYAGKLNLTLRYDSTRLTKTTARRLLDSYVERLETAWLQNSSQT